MSRIEDVARLKELEAKGSQADVFFQDEQPFGECIQISPSHYEGGIEGYERTGEVFMVVDRHDPEAYPIEHAKFENINDADLYVETRKLLKNLLAVAGQFQAGDVECLMIVLAKIAYMLDRKEISALDRMLTAARLMEDET
jgi:hypothetical protein